MSDTYFGDVRAMSFNLVPQGWARCNGQLLPIAQNRALFSLLGTRYGGDGLSTFALPALPGMPVQQGPAMGYCICINGTYPEQ